MITKTDIMLICISISCFVGSYFVNPYTKQYEGATGYIYEYGLVFDIVGMVLVVVGVMMLAIPTIHNLREIN